ncbi:hypothetical protein BV898_02785 [Hypsibius exemplaris]|uniref:Uncharacterized protein n=1 Tax=Hypsibius exemplaris TaxID=2072580 RepID=A0A1W0X732_HYPEX|nr:hypothetical protein BV898_02785 [Hypsibius exemplaris]
MYPNNNLEGFKKESGDPVDILVELPLQPLQPQMRLVSPPPPSPPRPHLPPPAPSLDTSSASPQPVKSFPSFANLFRPRLRRMAQSTGEPAAE